MFYLLNNDQPMSTTSTRSDMDVRLNAFRACTLAANFDNEESRCLVKLTATNLIAANFVSGQDPAVVLYKSSFLNLYILRRHSATFLD